MTSIHVLVIFNEELDKAFEVFKRLFPELNQNICTKNQMHHEGFFSLDLINIDYNMDFSISALG